MAKYQLVLISVVKYSTAHTKFTPASTVLVCVMWGIGPSLCATCELPSLPITHASHIFLNNLMCLLNVPPYKCLQEKLNKSNFDLTHSWHISNIALAPLKQFTAKIIITKCPNDGWYSIDWGCPCLNSGHLKCQFYIQTQWIPPSWQSQQTLANTKNLVSNCICCMGSYVYIISAEFIMYSVVIRTWAYTMYAQRFDATKVQCFQPITLFILCYF